MDSFDIFRYLFCCVSNVQGLKFQRATEYGTLRNWLYIQQWCRQGQDLNPQCQGQDLWGQGLYALELRYKVHLTAWQDRQSTKCWLLLLNYI